MAQVFRCRTRLNCKAFSANPEVKSPVADFLWLGVNDQIVAWLKNPRGKPGWMTHEQFDALPDEITVRELRYRVLRKGFRVKKITLVTMLLDDELYSLPELAELHRQRWEQETNFGHVKTTMKLDVLKCKTVDGVLQELHVLSLIYRDINAIQV